jgi:cysteine desulfurase
MPTVYFDYNATTPLDREVREAMMPFLIEIWGNPSSVHQLGRRARALLDDARDRTAHLFDCKPSEIVFTSGGTESANLAVFGVARLLRSKGRHLVISAIEHHAVLHSCEYLQKKEGFELTYLPVNHEGLVAVESLEKAIRPDTILVSVMAANNEIGTIQPVQELGTVCQKHGILFHTDAVQHLGKVPFENIHQFNADLVSVCAHKIHGPKGAGALFMKSPLHPNSILFGGGHENERRAGTENLAAIVGLVEALERFVKEPVFDKTKLSPLMERLLRLIDTVEGAKFVGSRESRLVNTVSFVVPGADSITLLAGLDMEGICASSGSACSAGSLEPSHVVRALGVEESLANSLVRFSLGRESTLAEIEYVERILPKVIRQARESRLVS